MFEKLIDYLEKSFEFESHISFILRIGFSILEIIAIILIAKILLKLTKFLINKFVKIPKHHTNTSERKINVFRYITYSVFKYTIYIVAFHNILDIIGFPVEAILTVVGIGSVALGFASQSLVKDVIIGLFVLIEDQLFVGDVIQIGAISGTVEKIGIRTTCIRGTDGSLHIIPNSEIKIVTNKSKRFRRIILNLVVEKNDSIDAISTHIEKCLIIFYKKHPEVIKQPFINGISEIRADSITYTIICECEVELYDKLDMEIKKDIKEYFDNNHLNLKSI